INNKLYYKKKYTLFPYTTLFRSMMENNVSSLVVMDSNNNNKPIGIVTERDLVRKVCLNDASSSNMLIKNIMSSFPLVTVDARTRSEEHTSELQSPDHLVCRLLLE